MNNRTALLNFSILLIRLCIKFQYFIYQSGDPKGQYFTYAFWVITLCHSLSTWGPKFQYFTYPSVISLSCLLNFSILLFKWVIDNRDEYVYINNNILKYCDYEYFIKSSICLLRKLRSMLIFDQQWLFMFLFLNYCWK